MEETMSRFQWSTRAVEGASPAKFAEDLERELNQLEAEEFEVDDIMDAPGGRAVGVVIIGKKPRRFPSPAPFHSEGR
jgi:hypothetical protein